MGLALTKLELAKQLLNTTDKNIINHFKAVFESRNSDWWNEIPDKIKSRIEEGIKQADAGRGTPHKDVMKKYKKWLKKK